jgi:hypothetical protein
MRKMFSIMALSIFVLGCSGTGTGSNSEELKGGNKPCKPCVSDAGPVTPPPTDAAPPVPPPTDAAPPPVDAAPPPPDANNEPPPVVNIPVAPETNEDFYNPERGLYVGVKLMNSATSTGSSSARSSGHNIAIALIRLDAYRDKPLDAAFLTTLENGFKSVRGAGIKVVLRFMYNSSDAAPPTGGDAPKAIVLQHIQQLTPVIQKNADVIMVMQAGFIGAWGEWHGSTNGLTSTANEKEITTALLAALPASRMVQIRTPDAKDAMFPGGPISAADAFNGSNRSRLGHHNDCFLASPTDYGTYPSPMSFWLDYVAKDTRYSPHGGETCNLSPPRSDCANAVKEMDLLNTSYLNEQYNTKVLDVWRTQGCFEEVKRRLGYRFVITRVAHSQAAPPGGTFELEFDVLNRGFAAPFNRRDVRLVLTNGTVNRSVILPTDVRLWEGGKTTTVKAKIKLPYLMAPGNWKLMLVLADEAPALSTDHRYSIRFANEGTYNAATGETTISPVFPVDPSVPGPVDKGNATTVIVP